MENAKERVIRYLDDAWAVEKALVDMLQEMADEVDEPAVREAFLMHREMTHQQEESLEARIRALGAEPSGAKGFFNKMAAKVGDLLHAAHDPMDKTTTNLMKAFGTENLEMAMYAALDAYATAIGDHETAQLARTIYQQEKETADKVWALIKPSAIRPAQETAAATSTV